MSFWGQLNLMDPASFIQSEMILFHDHALILLVGILTLVSIVGIKFIINKFNTRNVHEAPTVEVIWTIIPATLLLWLALPSLRLLYLSDEQGSEGIVLKAVGHQWYWSYSIPALDINSYDSYMIPSSELGKGEFRLLEVDRRTIVPFNSAINVLTTSNDVIHSFALPSLGVKVDAVPGRINSTGFSTDMPGVYYGQCSEICGANHAFMPIVVEAVQMEYFILMSKPLKLTGVFF
uniref:Cytochrome c oxidase subunit 2 n=1 Tax=Euphaedusa planostriata TaxID=2798995 RepID=A0A7T7D6K2_9EUPU|nr:cytochrome c oxidase subunit II [Euphaedusa planostriata]QQL04603.1 cytochrome c oxidase subunit II [Euphaedusa planostriata]